MAWKTLLCRIQGTSPILLHNGQTADPLNHYAKEMKKISGKRNKTDADHEALMKVEWQAGLYVKDQKVGIPDVVIAGMLTESARKKKKGPASKSGLIVDGFFSLEHDGPSDLEKLWKDGRFRLTTKVRVQRNAVMRTRPKFDQWALQFPVELDDQQIDKEELEGILEIGGRTVGIGDWRPRYGRFKVIELKEVKGPG